MILYADASALAKRYLVELGSAEFEALFRDAHAIATSLISRAEVSAAMAKAVRTDALERSAAERILRVFRQHWGDLLGLQVTESLVAEADSLAWEHGLRGYDAVHMASAMLLQAEMSEPVILATFDRQLWETGRQIGMEVWPEVL
jgi:predicted nucleic acid-binding protein